VSALEIRDRHTVFLVGRLRAMGLEVQDPAAGETSVSGRLPLSSERFEALEGPIMAPEARFFTLGHCQLKFFAPLPLFRLAAIEVGRLTSAAEIERALRLAWAAHVHRLREARDWLEALGAPTRASDGGTRLELELDGTRGEAAEVLSRSLILIPSVGPARDVSAREPSDRRLRPLPSLEHAFELDIGVTQALEDLERRARAAGAAGRRPGREVAAVEGPSVSPLLLVVADAAERAVARTTLEDFGLVVEATQDPLRALDSLRRRSFTAAVIDARLPRTDGVELAVRLVEAAGVETLPVVILDDRPTHAVREAARAAGAAAYVIRPIVWSRMAETLLDLVEHWVKRRFSRFGSSLGVVVESDPSARAEVAQEVGRGGMRLCSRRDVAPGAIERYRIRLPPPHDAVRVEGEVVWRQADSASTLVHAGVRFFRFLEGSEPRWIDLMTSLGARSDTTAA
jgi:two-component system chemotaxis response regulator CheY